MKSRNLKLKRFLLALIGAVVITTALGFDIFIQVANRIQDEVYQTHKTPNSEIVIIGMDEKALELYGAMPWSRDIITNAINELNKDSSKKPAVIGLDTLFTTSSDEKLDEELVNAVKNAGNVVTATNITFGKELVTLDDGSFYMEEYSVLLVEEPFLELKEVAPSGHLNAMLDIDGILRHAIWEAEIENGVYYPSFHQVIYKEYMEFKGESDINIPYQDARGRWYVSFTSYPGSYDDGYSIVDLVNGNLDADLFKDKIVLIGPYALGMSDEYFTSIDHATKMFGVEYQANAIANLINKDLKLEVLESSQQFILFIITFLALFFLYEKKLYTSSIIFVLGSVLWIVLAITLWNFGIVIHIFYVPVSLAICYLISIIINYFKSALEKNKITKAFKRYVAPQVVSKLLENQDIEPELGGKVTDIAVLFADIRGFTPLSEALSAPEVAEILNRYLSMMSEVVFKYNGTLDKFMGDCVMAFWGAPIYQDDIVKKSVEASIEMMEKAKLLEEEISKQYNHKVGIGIGINFGPAVVGNFGSKNRMDYTAIGDTVNVASRLESNAKSGNILVSEVVKEILEKEIEFSKINEEIVLKGKTKTFEIYKVIKILE